MRVVRADEAGGVTGRLHTSDTSELEHVAKWIESDATRATTLIADLEAKIRPEDTRGMNVDKARGVLIGRVICAVLHRLAVHA